MRALIRRDRRCSPRAPTSRPHSHTTGTPDRSLRSAYNNALDEVALYNISDGAADTFRTTGDLLLPWMRKSDFRGALCPEQNSARCEASTFDAVGTLFRLMIPVAAAVRERVWAEARTEEGASYYYSLSSLLLVYVSL